MSDTATAPLVVPIPSKPKPHLPPPEMPVAATPVEEPLSYWVCLIDIRMPMGNVLVSRRAGTILHPRTDAQIISAIKNAYSTKPPLPIRKLSQSDYEMLVLRGRM